MSENELSKLHGHNVKFTDSYGSLVLACVRVNGIGKTVSGYRDDLPGKPCVVYTFTEVGKMTLEIVK
jgi:hypothetical protein